MKVGKLFPALRDEDLRVALAGPFREKLKAAADAKEKEEKDRLENENKEFQSRLLEIFK